MAPPTRGRKLKTPLERVTTPADGYFFPNEVVRMLALERLDYRQLRRLFKLVATSRGDVAPRKWARFTFQDLASLRAAIAALGGLDVIASTKRLPLKRLERACARLREDYGLTNPLTQARLVWTGRDVAVQLLGARFEPDSGQLLLHLSDNLNEHLDYASASRAERKALGTRVVAETRLVVRDGRSNVRAALSAAELPSFRFGLPR